MNFSDLLRYGLWLSVAESAMENRREYHMTTTWLPHLLTNSLSLLLPDLLRILIPPRKMPLSVDAPPLTQDLEAIEETLVATVRDNPNYAVYVTPLAVGYILSHPRFNIYKGKMAEKRFAGLGLDALPHGSTAFGLTALVIDASERASQIVPRQNPLYPLLRWCKAHPALFSGAVLAGATLFWEVSEYGVHQHELELQGGDVSKINMQWSVEDTARDCAANAIGWALALLLRQLH